MAESGKKLAVVFNSCLALLVFKEPRFYYASLPYSNQMERKENDCVQNYTWIMSEIRILQEVKRVALVAHDNKKADLVE
jgi:hypothetical protein